MVLRRKARAETLGFDCCRSMSLNTGFSLRTIPVGYSFFRVHVSLGTALFKYRSCWYRSCWVQVSLWVHLLYTHPVLYVYIWCRRASNKFSFHHNFPLLTPKPLPALHPLLPPCLPPIRKRIISPSSVYTHNILRQELPRRPRDINYPLVSRLPP